MRVIEAEVSALTIQLSPDEATALTNALNEVCNGPDALEEWEFQARVGVLRSEAAALLAALSAVL